MNKPVLVLVLSSSCGACMNLKKKLPELEKDLKNDPRFKFVVLEFNEMAVSKDGKDKNKQDFHPELKNGFVEFFPTFLLFPGNLWNNKTSKLKGVAKHELKKNPQIDYSKVSILSWIDNAIKYDPLFGNSDSVIVENTKSEMYVPTYGTHFRFKGTKPE